MKSAAKNVSYSAAFHCYACGSDYLVRIVAAAEYICVFSNVNASLFAVLRPYDFCCAFYFFNRNGRTVCKYILFSVYCFRSYCVRSGFSRSFLRTVRKRLHAFFHRLLFLVFPFHNSKIFCSFKSFAVFRCRRHFNGNISRKNACEQTVLVYKRKITALCDCPNQCLRLCFSADLRFKLQAFACRQFRFFA